jgi:hypothetical protein
MGSCRHKELVPKVSEPKFSDRSISRQTAGAACEDSGPREGARKISTHTTLQVTHARTLTAAPGQPTQTPTDNTQIPRIAAVKLSSGC